MVGVKAVITKCICDGQPGFVECQIIDVHGRCWIIHEKSPIVYHEYLDHSSNYPIDTAIACNVLSENGDVVVIDTYHPWYVESVEGVSQFEVWKTSLAEMDLPCIPLHRSPPEGGTPTHFPNASFW